MNRTFRISVLTHSLGVGGSERVSVNLANHFASQGCAVHLLPLNRVREEYPVSDDVDLDLGVPQQGARLLRGLRKLRYVAAALERAKPDVILSLGAGYGYLTAVSLVRRRPLVTSLRNDPHFLFAGHAARRLSYRLAFALSTRVVFQTADAKEYFGARLKAKGVVVANPLRAGLPRNDSPLAARRHEVVSFGRLTAQKRLDVLLSAFATFHTTHPGYRLAVFGDGDESSRLETLIRDSGLDGLVSIEPSRSDIHARILDAAMYVSTSDVEGISNSMIEAMAIGLPSVCTDCPPGGARQTIEQFGTGLLASVGDADSVARQMARIADSPGLADSMIEAGRVLRRQLDPRAVGDLWLDLLREAANAAPVAKE